MGIHWERQCLLHTASALGTGLFTPRIAISEGKCRELFARAWEAGAAWPGDTFGPWFQGPLWSTEQEQQPHRTWLH